MATSATATATSAPPALGLGDAPPPAPRRPRVLFVGTALAAAASVATFATLLGVYLEVRSQVIRGGDEWLPAGSEIPLSPGTMSLVTLAMSLVTVQWVVHAAAERDRPHTYLGLGVTILLGVGHIVQMGYLFTQWGVALNGETSAAATLLFAVVGAHVAMTTAALLYLTLMGLRSLGGQFTGRDAEGLSAAALYWWVTVALFAVVWFAVLVTK